MNTDQTKELFRSLDSLWLVRTVSNWIAGPYKKRQLIALIQDQKLGFEDEVCVQSGFWIKLNNPVEVSQYLGTEAFDALDAAKEKQRKEREEQVTVTGNAAHHEITLTNMATSPRETKESATSEMTSTRVLSSMTPQAGEVQRGTLESKKIGVFQSITWILVILSAFLFWLIIRVLKYA